MGEPGPKSEASKADVPMPGRKARRKSQNRYWKRRSPRMFGHRSARSTTKEPIPVYQRLKTMFPQMPYKDDVGLQKEGPWNQKPAAFFYDRSYDQTVTADACFSVFLRATASRKSYKTLVFYICKY